MNTPICDFVHSYVNNNTIRLHMPGHKGIGMLGCEMLDITEIPGADSLYEADGIIKQSENNASALFGCDTYYSTEGSSLSIRAMLYLTCLYAEQKGEKMSVLAGRNAHKVFFSAAALLGFDVKWIYSESDSSYLSCSVDSSELDKILCSSEKKPTAVYITSPDYLGNEVDIKSISEVCHKYGVLLLVDNAHGAYLKFLPESRYPIDLGADMCCASAHKTLPVLTGGAYLHISDFAPRFFHEKAKDALALFGSTSPSYLILQSLDIVNDYLDGRYKDELKVLIEKVAKLKEQLLLAGFSLSGDEELKVTISTKPYGYYGNEFAELLYDSGLMCEYSDPDFVVLMFTTQIIEKIDSIRNIILTIPKKEAIKSCSPELTNPCSVVSIKDSYFRKSEVVSVDDAEGRILAVANVSCPPAVPIVVSGELISHEVVECFRYYGVKQCTVIVEDD